MAGPLLPVFVGFWCAAAVFIEELFDVLEEVCVFELLEEESGGG